MDFRLLQPQVAKLDRLLHMEYTVSELASELDDQTRHIQHAIDVGAPHRKTAQTTYIIGDEFRLWYKTQRNSRKLRLSEGEFYCLSCKARVRPTEPSELTVLKNNVVQERSKCPKCGGTVNRFRSESEVEL